MEEISIKKVLQILSVGKVTYKKVTMDLYTKLSQFGTHTLGMSY